MDRIPLLSSRAAWPQITLAQELLERLSMIHVTVQACPAAHPQAWASTRGTAQHPRSESRKKLLYQPDVQMVVSPCTKSVGCSGSGKGCQRSWLGVTSECDGSALAPNLAGSMPSAGLYRELLTEGLILYSQLLKFCPAYIHVCLSNAAAEQRYVVSGPRSICRQLAGQ